jgi:iron only hydrogenase large subunit-like protein/nitrogen-specific signal transduction histidine kinase
MGILTGGSFITTVKERCRVCYTCVRECPAKAIRIADGQAEIMGERCINCGNCVKVCSQGAKQVIDSIDEVRRLIASNDRVAAIVAPSFPAEYPDIPFETLVGMIRELGFSSVHEVGFGADLVAARYRTLLRENPGRRFIAANCPAVVTYIEKYHPDLVEFLAPVVSPMIAIARALRSAGNDRLKIVFIGPCIAKKQEASSRMLSNEVNAALTYKELSAMFAGAEITPGQVQPGDFDAPHSGYGALFPISRGFLQAAGMTEDLALGEVVVADGRTEFIEALKEFGNGHMEVRLLEVLGCNGCIMGPGFGSQLPRFGRRAKVGEYARHRMQTIDRQRWLAEMAEMGDLDLGRTYCPEDQRILAPSDQEMTRIMGRMGKYSPHDELNCGACGYESCREHAVAIYKGFAESEMCLPYTIDQLRRTVGELAISNERLANTQEALQHSEKLASMGQLAAGIAHEVNNPLGVVLMYSHLLLEEYEKDPKLRDDLCLIAEQADRCKKIVAGLLGFARQNKVLYERVDIRSIVERSLLTLPAPENIEVKVDHTGDPMAELDRDQIIQVMTNLISNAYGAMPDGGTMTVKTEGNNGSIIIRVSDTGAGIPTENLNKIFEPFFSTKQIGKGTGLGLAVTYGIVKMHYGDIRVTSNADPSAGPTGTTFTVTLPRKGQGE